jgi:hypothetical protein
MEKITNIIKEKKLTPKQCEYHTLRTTEDGTKLRALVIKGDDTLHIEFICGKCGTDQYHTQEYKKVSKAAKIRARVACSKCGNKIKIDKMKSKKK